MTDEIKPEKSEYGKYWFNEQMEKYSFSLVDIERDRKAKTEIYENPFGYKVLSVTSRSSSGNSLVRIIIDQDDVPTPYFEIEEFLRALEETRQIKYSIKNGR